MEIIDTMFRQMWTYAISGTALYAWYILLC